MSRIGKAPIELPTSVNVAIFPGRIQVAGPLGEFLRSPTSLTAQYLRGDRFVPVPAQRRQRRDLTTSRKHDLGRPLVGDRRDAAREARPERPPP